MNGKRLYQTQRPTAVLDIETYRNYFLVMLRDIATRKVCKYELYPGKLDGLDTDGLKRTLASWRIVTFNGRNYDMPLIMLALNGASNEELKDASDLIIQQNVKPWEFERHYDISVEPSYLDHIDLIEVAPGQASLKIYGGRLHSRWLQDLPIHHDSLITQEQREILRRYCANDLDTTIDLYNKLLPQINLRCSMSDEYGTDLRSKSDAQIAEAVIRRQVEDLLGRKLQRPEVKREVFNYKAPDFIKYQTEPMKELLLTVLRAKFVVNGLGRVDMPAELNERVICIGESEYRMGIGGLHSSESCVTHRSDDDYVLLDRDVASYYPAIILGQHLSPRNMGDAFQRIYSKFVRERLAAKKRVAEIRAELDDLKKKLTTFTE